MKKVNGYCIIVDIKNSVDQKQVDEDSWLIGTKQWLSDFQRMVRSVISDTRLEKLHFKFLGDGALVFLKSDEADAKLSRKIMKEAIDFSFYTKIKNDLETSFVWRTVVCYLEDVGCIDFQNELTGEQYELVGPPLDLTFRLQKLADTTHIVVNKEFYDSIARELRGLGLDSLACYKRIKGWNQPIEFYALTNIEWLERTIENNQPNVNFLDLNLELFQYYLSLTLNSRKKKT